MNIYRKASIYCLRGYYVNEYVRQGQNKLFWYLLNYAKILLQSKYELKKSFKQIKGVEFGTFKN